MEDRKGVSRKVSLSLSYHVGNMGRNDVDESLLTEGCFLKGLAWSDKLRIYVGRQLAEVEWDPLPIANKCLEVSGQRNVPFGWGGDLARGATSRSQKQTTAAKGSANKRVGVGALACLNTPCSLKSLQREILWEEWEGFFPSPSLWGNSAPMATPERTANAALVAFWRIILERAVVKLLKFEEGGGNLLPRRPRPIRAIPIFVLGFSCDHLFRSRKFPFSLVVNQGRKSASPLLAQPR